MTPRTIGRAPAAHFFHRSKIEFQSLTVRAGFQISIKRARKMATLGRASKSPVFFTIMLALLHILFQFLLVVGKQGIEFRGAFRR